ncbi:MAG: ComEA family DNA-binding protein [Candidatus Levybacteria bacterium]|nr:ComEA family DNA-binding protein [Candidatus Levybacteria bacterium]
MPQELPKIFHRIFTGTIAFVRKYPFQTVLGALGLILFVLGLISLLTSNPSEEKIIFEDQKEATQEIVIDIEGAVVKPGVYKLPTDSRIKDALIAASGLNENANRDWVAKNLNLAQKLTDGAKVYVPKIGESAKGAMSGAGSVNVNSASLSELEALPGIGAVTAQKVVDNRPYTSIEELLEKKVIGKAVFEKIKEKIAVY